MRRSAVVFTELVDFEGHRDLAMLGLGSGRWTAARYVLRRRNVAALRRVVRLVVRESQRCFISSETDRQALGDPDVQVLPNSGHRFEPATDRDLMSTVPSISFVGSLGYPPNGDAVTWMVADVWSLVRRQLPDVVLRVVGERELAATLSGQEYGLWQRRYNSHEIEAQLRAMLQSELSAITSPE
jgi:hypothetical protein